MADEVDYDENDGIDGSMTDMWVPKMASCSCCKGYIYGCSGGLCKSLGVCECSAAEEFEKEEREAANGQAAMPSFELQRGVVNGGAGGGGRSQQHHGGQQHQQQYQQQGGRGGGGGRGRGGGGAGGRGSRGAPPPQPQPFPGVDMEAMMAAFMQQMGGTGAGSGGQQLVMPAPGGMAMPGMGMAMPGPFGLAPMPMPGMPGMVMPVLPGMPGMGMDMGGMALPVAGFAMPLMAPVPGGTEVAWNGVASQAQAQGQGQGPLHLRSNASEFVPSGPPPAATTAAAAAAAAAGVWSSPAGAGAGSDPLPGLSLSALGINAPPLSSTGTTAGGGAGAPSVTASAMYSPAGVPAGAFLLPKGLTDTPVPTPGVPPPAPVAAGSTTGTTGGAWSQRKGQAQAGQVKEEPQYALYPEREEGEEGGADPVAKAAHALIQSKRKELAAARAAHAEAGRQRGTGGGGGGKQGGPALDMTSPSAPAPAPVIVASSSQAVLLATVTDPEEARLRKEIHKREKKVRDCEELEKRQGAGEALDETQRVKLGNKGLFQTEMSEASAKLEAYLASRPSQAAPAPSPAPAAAAGGAGGKGQGSKAPAATSSAAGGKGAGAGASNGKRK